MHEIPLLTFHLKTTIYSIIPHVQHMYVTVGVGVGVVVIWL